MPSAKRILGGSLLRLHPVVRPRQLDGHVRKEEADRLAIGLSTVIRRDEQRSGLLVVSPGGEDETRLRVSPVVKCELPDPKVVADVECPGVARRIAAARI